MQMNYHYVDYSSNPTMVIHNTWQQELENVGYPTQSRNIAISNGNECAVDHGFNPRDKFLSLHDAHTPTVVGDLIRMIVVPLAGVFTSDLELSFLGSLPGSSKFFVDYDLRANPEIGQTNREVYWGKMRYEKKLLWLIKISHTITERTKNAPNGYLPFDTYSGGYYDINYAVGEYSGYLPSNTIVNPKYGFIPVVSALDIKRNNEEVTPSDYLLNYAGGNTPEPALTSGFDNFIVDFMRNSPINNEHISFQQRNGDWLANEINEDPNLIADCSDFCSNATISGSSFLCTSRTYSVTNTTTAVTWWISEGNSAVTTSVNGNEITLTATNSNQNSNVVLNVTYGNDRCGTVTVSKDIKVGIPNYPSTPMSGDNSVYVGQYKTYSVLAATGATSYHWYIDYGSSTSDDGSPTGAWVIQSGQDTRNINVLVGSINTSIVVVCKASNSCGDVLKYKYVTVGTTGGTGGGGTIPCDDGLKIKSNPMKSNNPAGKIIYVEDPCDDGGLKTGGTRNYTLEVFNKYSVKVYSKTQNNKEFDLNNLERGFYIVKYQTKLGNIITKKILIE